MLLRSATPPAWTAAVLADLDAFLLDHAANERKASAAALALVAHYPDRPALVAKCIALAREELSHFEEVVRLIAERGRTLLPDTRSVYLGRLAREYRAGSDAYFLDRLVTGAIVEARGCERFGLLATALPDGCLKDFYRDLARSEARHQETYLELARTYFPAADVASRLEEILEAESRLVAELPVRATLY